MKLALEYLDCIVASHIQLSASSWDSSTWLLHEPETLCFKKTGSHCRPGEPWMHRNPLASASSVLGLKGAPLHPASFFFRCDLVYYYHCVCVRGIVYNLWSRFSPLKSLWVWGIELRLPDLLDSYPCPLSHHHSLGGAFFGLLRRKDFTVEIQGDPLFSFLLWNCWVIFNLELLWGFPYKPFFLGGACFDFAQVNA